MQDIGDSMTERGKTFVDELSASIVDHIKNTGHIACLHEHDWGRINQIADRLEKIAEKQEIVQQEMRAEIRTEMLITSNRLTSLEQERSTIKWVIGAIGLVTAWSWLSGILK